MTDQIISQEGYDKLAQEFNALVEKRREIADRIERAKEMGDLSENAEYTEAKEAQAFNEGRIAELNNLIKNVTIVANGGGAGLVGMGSRVMVEVDGAEKEFTIVSFNEVDPRVGKISNESPLGLAFIGRKTGDKFKVITPKGELAYKIIGIY